MPSSQLQDPDYKLRHAGKSRAPELPRKRALSEIAQRFAPELQREENEEAGLLAPPLRFAPTAETRRGLPPKGADRSRDRRCPHPNDNFRRSVGARHDADAQ